MAIRNGRTFVFEKEIRVLSSAGVAGRLEGEGPLGKCFDKVFEDTSMGEKCWERAESDLLSAAMKTGLQKGNINEEKIDAVFAVAPKMKSDFS